MAFIDRLIYNINAKTPIALLILTLISCVILLISCINNKETFKIDSDKGKLYNR